MKWVFVLTLVLLVLEYLAFSLMIPLAAGDLSASVNNGIVMHFWVVIAEKLSISPTRINWIWLFLLLLGLRTIFGYIYTLLSMWVAKQVHSYLSERAFSRVLISEAMTQIYQRSIGYYLTIAGDDTFKAGTIIQSAAQTLSNLTSVFACFLLLYLFSVKIFSWTLFFIVLMGLMVATAMVMLLRVNALSVAMSSQARTTFVEAINSLRSIRSMAAEYFVVKSYDKQIHDYVRLLFKIDAIRNGMKFLPGVIAIFAGFLVIWPHSHQDDQMAAAFFFAASTLLIRLFISLGGFVNTSSMMISELRAVKDINSLINGHIPFGSDKTDTFFNEVIIAEISLKNLYYGYIEGLDVFKGLNLNLKRGEFIAVMGPSGSGKSTLADLLLGLIQPSSGKILVNSGSVSPQQLSSHVILVEQHARIFSTTVRENILLGAHYSDEKILKALQMVDLENFIHNLSGGLDAIFEYQGANLSGGQRQRLAIARALIREPQVLILDEATSALDGETRNRLLDNLKNDKHNRITIFITHDKLVAEHADVVFDLNTSSHTSNKS